MVDVKRPVLVCGENPAFTLYDDSGERNVVASYWHITWSQYGAGHVLILWLRDSPQATGIYADNAPLAALLLERLVRHFPEFERLAIETAPQVAATLNHSSDGHSFYAVECRPEGRDVIKLRWAELLDVKQIAWPAFPTGDILHDLTTVICPCRSASVMIDTHAIPGAIQTGESGGYPSSSAFLAFSETWVVSG